MSQLTLYSHYIIIIIIIIIKKKNESLTFEQNIYIVKRSHFQPSFLISYCSEDYFSFSLSIPYFQFDFFSLKALFGRREWNRIEWNGIKRIFLEYSSLPLFGSFNGGNRMSIPLFGSLSGREWNGQEGMLIPPFSLKTSNFCSPKNWEEWEGMNLGLMKFLLKSLKYPFNISPFFLIQP